MARRSRKIEYAVASESIVSPTARPLLERWWGKLLLLLVGTLLLTFSYAPFYQFWAGWIGLVPLIVVLRHTRSGWTAAFWSWIAGVLFFAANVWWLLDITGPGVIALVLWLGLYWLLAAVVLRPMVRRTAATFEADGSESGDAKPPASPIIWLFALPAVWVGAEWIRGQWPFQGFSWFYMAHAQTPVLHLCQIADLLGEQGVSFWVVMINALVALFIFNGWRWRGLLRPVLAVAGVMLAIAVYGGWRFAQTESHLTPGPTVLVVQPNYPQSNTGEKGAPIDDIIDFHVVETNKALKLSPQTDLVVWSETMMPPLNDEAFAATERVRKEYKLSENEFGGESIRARRQIMEIARRYKTALLAGGSFTKDVQVAGGYVTPTGRRNSAYYFARDTGALVDRFDKIHLVPFGEYIPFQEAFPALYRQLIALGPPDMENYQLDRGDRVVLFELPKDRQVTGPSTPEAAWRFVTPICFEDADGDLNAMFFRGGANRGVLEGGKKADFIVNVTNDGWFMLPMLSQHLQVGTFRSIENRAPTARSVNTGISGYIDSLGRTRHDLLLPVRTEGTLVHQLMIDSRTTFFTRWGNLIGPAGAIAIAFVAVMNIIRRRRAA